MFKCCSWVYHLHVKIGLHKQKDLVNLICCFIWLLPSFHYLLNLLSLFLQQCSILCHFDYHLSSNLNFHNAQKLFWLSNLLVQLCFIFFLEILLNFKTNANTLLILFCLLFDLSSMMTLAPKESLVSYHILTFSKQVSFKPLVSWPVRLRFVLTYWIRVIF